jgi:soluble lytic murein transglycosylase-like protein
MNPTAELSDAERLALATALDDEYKSHETYRRVIADFGPVRPFINIVEAEARHIAALLALFKTYAVAPPANRWAGRAPRFADVHAACVAGVQGEIENVALYDRLLPATQRPDLLQVFHALRSASQDRHLPAFQRCAQRG